MGKLTCTTAKKIDLVDYLASIGHLPQQVTNGSDYWYRSPLREELTASFKVNRKLNVYYDHGTGKGGDLIDFGKAYFRCTINELMEVYILPNQHIRLLLDSDKAGVETTLKVPEWETARRDKFIDCSNFYSGFQDLNDWLKSCQPRIRQSYKHEKSL